MESCTLYGILARDGRSVVVFRRGPSRAVLLLRWWLGSDKIEEGQWLRGRIYGNRCDLSPNGEYLLYFASKRKRELEGNWSAISRPPFLTALAFWPREDHRGGCPIWGGGGIFVGPRQVALDHRSTEMSLARGFSLPKDWRVEPFSPPDFNLPGGSNVSVPEPVECSRLVRDGWEFPLGTVQRESSSRTMTYRMYPPLLFRRRQPGNADLILSFTANGSFARDQSPLLGRAEVGDQSGRVLRRFGAPDWVEFSHEGDLLIANTGCLYRLPAHCVALASEDPLEGAKLVADLRPLVFRQRVALPAATRW